MNILKKSRLLAAVLFVFAALLSSLACATPGSGYWWNPAEPGRGFVIEIQGTTMFMAGFLYDTSGRASWVASNGPMTTPTTYSGDLITYSGGQTLTGAFKAASLVTPKLGTISINFTSDTAGTVTWPGGTIPIQRFDFGPGGSGAAQPSTNPATGWWWNENEGGRGFAIEVQGGSMYFAGYMYDATGNPIWYLASGNMTNTSLYSGVWQQYGNGQTLTGPFKAAAVVNSNVGSVTLQITNNSVATLTLPDGRQIPFTRFNFGVTGLTLAAFSPAASAPAQLLRITGAGFDPAQTLGVTIFDDVGYSVTLPPVSETTTQVVVSIPPYVNVATSVFGSGTVKMKAVQGATTSNTLTGFQIQALPTAQGTPGTSTLSLVRASLAEAQRLQTAIHNTPQDTPALQDALGRQVANLQTLATNVSDVVTKGLSFTLGIVGTQTITVTSSNISNVDQLILATMQSLASPGAGSGLHAEAATPVCLGTEANAFANGAGGSNSDLLAQNFIAAACNSTACKQSADFLSAYRLYSGVGSTGLGVTNNLTNFGSALKNGSVAALLSTLIGNSSTSVALNNVICLPNASDQAAVKTGVADVTKLQQSTLNTLLPKTTGTLSQNLVGSLTVTNIVAPPPPTGGGISGTWTGTFSSGDFNCLFSGSWTATVVDNNGVLTGSWLADDGSSGTLSGVHSGTLASWSSSGGGSGVTFSGTITGTSIVGTFSSTNACTPGATVSGPFNGFKS